MTLLILLFAAGYAAIVFEGFIRVNKTAVALGLGVVCWMALGLLSSDQDVLVSGLKEHLSGIAEIVFFLLGAMTIVELINSHGGFELIAEKISAGSQRSLLLIISLLTFFLSAVLDNLTTAIVMMSLIQRIVPDAESRRWHGAAVIVAANAGGAWSPIGDVTTTMLWTGGQLTALNVVRQLFVPSIISALVPLLYIGFHLKGPLAERCPEHKAAGTWQKRLVLLTGIGILLLVPVFKSLFYLPPYMGMLLGLSLIWIVISLLVPDEEKANDISEVMRRIDLSSILFFTGILLAVSALESGQVLRHAALWLDQAVGGSKHMAAMVLGLVSALVDNVPLVSASMGMYPLSAFPADHYIWTLIAYCCGTGGSILIIGSAAGIAVMGIEKIDFLWYLRKVSLAILLGFLAGAFSCILMQGPAQ